MLYIFLAYQDKREWDPMSAKDRSTLVEACLASNEALREAGYLAATGSTQDRGATTIRFLNGGISISDSPLSRLDAKLVELLIINARDLNEAIRVASKMPQVYQGPIEVWPLA
jgi:hypothetical protein